MAGLTPDPNKFTKELIRLGLVFLYALKNNKSRTTGIGLGLVFALFAFGPRAANAWVCGRPCPSSIFSGKLECEAYQLTCPARIRSVGDPKKLVSAYPPPRTIKLGAGELSQGTGPVVILVNGFGGCNPCITPALQRALIEARIDTFNVDWNDINRRKQSTNLRLDDSEFLAQMRQVINEIPLRRPIVLIGHSFGGDSALKVASNSTRRIELLAVLDAVELGGVRSRRNVGPNVTYFYNRWTNYPTGLFVPALSELGYQGAIPFDATATSGEVGCPASSRCDQREHSYAYFKDGSQVREPCWTWEVTCPGYNATPIILGGSNGTKHRRVTHGGDNAIYRDELIQEQLLRLITALDKQSRATPSQQYALICLVNGSSHNIVFQYRWGQGPWESFKVGANAQAGFWWSHPSSFEGLPPVFQLRMDTDLSAQGVNAKTYTLNSWRHDHADCNKAGHKEVVVQIAPSTIGIFPNY
jgi:pimeloyl-ACP methyl ester carboxylesterase